VLEGEEEDRGIVLRSLKTRVIEDVIESPGGRIRPLTLTMRRVRGKLAESPAIKRERGISP